MIDKFKIWESWKNTDPTNKLVQAFAIGIIVLFTALTKYNASTIEYLKQELENSRKRNRELVAEINGCNDKWFIKIEEERKLVLQNLQIENNRKDSINTLLLKTLKKIEHEKN